MKHSIWINETLEIIQGRPGNKTYYNFKRESKKFKNLNDYYQIK